MTTVHLLQAYPDLREQYRRRFRHVLVDEYQDTNHAQYVLIRELCADDPEVEGPPGVDADRATGADGGGRLGPVDLRLPRGDDSQHQRLRDRLSRRPGDHAGAELPLHPDDLERGQRGDREEHRPQTEEPVVRCRRRCAGHRVRRRHRARRGPVRRRRDPPAPRGGGGPVRRRGGVLPDQRPVPILRGGVHPRRPALQGGRRRAVLRAARGARRHRLPAGHRQPDRRRVVAPDPQCAETRHRRPGRGGGRRVGEPAGPQLRRRATPGRPDPRPGDPLGQPAAELRRFPR